MNMDMRPSGEAITFDNSDELRAIVLRMVTDCARTLDITSRHLDPAIYDHADFIEAVKQVALNNRLARIRIIVTDTGPMISRGHRLLTLSTRLSSYIELRKPGRDYRHFNEAMLIADKRAYCHRQFADRYDGMANFDDQRRASDLTGKFEEIWERADIDANFRRLHL